MWVTWGSPQRKISENVSLPGREPSNPKSSNDSLRVSIAQAEIDLPGERADGERTDEGDHRDGRRVDDHPHEEIPAAQALDPPDQADEGEGVEVDDDLHPPVADDADEDDPYQHGGCVEAGMGRGGQFDEGEPGQGEADDDEPHVGLGLDARPSLGDRHEHRQVDDGDEDAGHRREDEAPADRVVVHEGHGDQDRDHDRLGDQSAGHPVAQLVLGGVCQVKPHRGVIGTRWADLYRRGSYGPIPAQEARPPTSRLQPGK